MKLLRKIVGAPYRAVVQFFQKRKFERYLKAHQGKDIRIVVGSSGVYEDGWIPGEIHFLNLLHEQDWLKYFSRNSISNILGEHVWEHLTPEQGRIAAKTCSEFIKKGGRVRVAVPDGFNPDKNYIEDVKPGGRGNGAFDHKILYNYKTFSQIFADNGFRIELLEYWDENGVFHANDWDQKDGHIQRSKRYDPRNVDGKLVYTSVIIDAIKI